MKRVLICDAQGMMPSRHLRNEYPNATFRVLEEAPTRDPHGEMVAECFLRGHGTREEVEIVFYPYIQLQQKNPYGWADAIQEVNPDICNCSFGVWDNDDGMAESMLKIYWEESSRAKAIPEKIGDTNVFFASGNFNRKWDKDDDIGYPGKALRNLPNVYLIASANRDGFPSHDSSDGLGIFCMAWGRDVRLWHPGRFDFVTVSGTSFAAPFVAGIMARDFGAQRFTREQAMAWLLERVTVAEGWTKGEPHPVAGYGDLTTYWEQTK